MDTGYKPNLLKKIKMKKYKIFTNICKQLFYKTRTSLFFIMACVSLMITSCVDQDDFVNLSPEDRIDAGAFFSNADELVFAVNGIYSSQRSVYGNTLHFYLIEARSDNAALNQYEQKERVETDTFEETPGNLLLVQVWTQNYILINNANTIIARAPDVPADNSVEEGLLTRSVGEAKFIRAMAYFTLVNMFGDLPLRIEPTTDFENADLARSPSADIYALIVSDLTDAISVLPNSYAGGSFNEVGRATKSAAQALLGKVQLQNGNKSAASSALSSVIGQYNLLANYADIHAPGNNNTAESVYEVNFNPANQTGLGMNNSFIPSSVASSLGIVAGGQAGRLGCFPTQDFMTIYEVGDLRSPSNFALYDNNGSMEPYISKYIDAAAAGSGSDINLVVLRYADVLLMKAEADGESAASYELINQVRRRAFGQDPGTADSAIDISSASPGTFLDKVMLERRRELAFENHRWSDLKRLSSSETLSIINAQMAAEYTGIPNVSAYQLIYPIPQGEIDVSNGVVTQNPGY